jgi:hypothetical protein
MQLDRDALLESNSGGIMPASQTFGNAPLTPRQKGLRMGVLLFGIALGLIPLMFLFRLIFVDKAIYLLVPAITFLLAGLIRTGYAMLLEEGEEVFRKGLKGSDSTARNASLPPRPVGMRHLTSRDKNADEMVAPPSATENTTQLLNKSRPDSQ